MNPTIRRIFPLLMLWIGIAMVVAAPMAFGQKSRSRTRNQQTGMIEWADWAPLKCERCEGNGKTTCGTCNGGRKKLAVRCAECSGKKKATCRECYGKGVYADPFVTCPCDRCEGRGAFPCFLCRGQIYVPLNGGQKGPKCRICSKKGYFKCTTCKGKGFQQLMQPEGASYTTATEAQLKALQKKIKPVLDKLDAFTGMREQQSQDKNKPPVAPKTIFRKEDYEAGMKAVIKLFPQFKKDMKKAISLGPKSLKHTKLSNYEKFPGQILRRSAGAAQQFMTRHQIIIDECLSVFSTNRRQQEMNRRAKNGGVGK